MKSSKPYRYDEAKRLWADIVGDLAILAGDKVNDNGASWQDVAGTLAVNLEVLAGRINEARFGNVADGPVVFPSPSDEPWRCIHGHAEDEPCEDCHRY